MNELDAVIKVLSNKLTNIWTSMNDEDNAKGVTGEEFIRYCIKQYFFDRGYKIRYYGINTFKVYKQVNSKGKGRGGIDFIVFFTNSTGKTYALAIEMKNLKKYKYFQKSRYKKLIQDRFYKIDYPNRQFYWALAINKSNISLIQKRCQSDNINIIPIDVQLIRPYFFPTILKQIFKQFMIDFDKYVTGVENGSIKRK